jgi:DNA-binding HxlR family transcriptional regulator
MEPTSAPACPIARSARLLGDEWVLLVLRELFKRPHKFDELQKKTTAASNILANRLGKMVAAGIVMKVSYQERPPRFKYQLTKAGLALLPLVLELMRYGEDWLPSETASPTRLRHLNCGKITRPGQTCSECGEAITLKNVRIESTADLIGTNSPGQ